MVTSSQQLPSRCTLCPAGCELGVVRAGPGSWRAEPPEAAGAGLCPRGLCLGELLTHRRRILWPARRVNGRLQPCDARQAQAEILKAAGGRDGKKILFLLDGNLPCQQLLAAAAWCKAWDQAGLCLVVEPGDRDLLLGAESSQAEYLPAAALAECDGFLIVGDVFAANPRCSSPILDRLKAQPRTPVAVIDPAGGAAAKFANRRVDCPPGMELAALLAVAAAAGAKIAAPPQTPPAEMPSCQAAGKALAACKRVGVLVSAEYGRAVDWQQVGQVAGAIAKALGGGLAVQTDGANALAAVRVEKRLGTIPLAAALSDDQAVRVAVGCDVLGMLGRADLSVFAAASPLPNRTVEAAQVVLPIAMTVELAGTFLLDLLNGGRPMEVGAILAPPAGLPAPAEVIAGLARAAGVAKPAAIGQGKDKDEEELLARLAPQDPVGSPVVAGAPVAAANPRSGGRPAGQAGLTLLLGRQAMHSGCGWLTRQASWQSGVQPVPEVRLAPADAQSLGLDNLDLVTVTTDGSDGKGVRARVRTSPELTGGVAVLSDGFPQSRTIVPCRLDGRAAAVIFAPAAAMLKAEQPPAGEKRHA